MTHLEDLWRGDRLHIIVAKVGKVILEKNKLELFECQELKFNRILFMSL